MGDHLHNEIKKEFQLERMILFSDAIFAIAITILVLEIKVPDINRHIATDELLLRSLDEMMPKFVGFLLSFFIIGRYWITHHRMFGYVINYTQKMLWLNLFFLLGIVLMPFSTGFFSEYILRFELKTPIAVYVSNVIFLGLMHLFLWRHISNQKNQLTEGLSRYHRINYSLWALIAPVIFILMSIVYIFINPRFDIYVLALIPICRVIINRRLAKQPK